MFRRRICTIGLAGFVACGGTSSGAPGASSNPLCCTEFKIGSTIDADIGGSAQSQVAAQAAADIAGIASSMVDDLTSACRAVAEDLDAPAADRQAAEANADKGKKMQDWCVLAVRLISTARAGASLSVQITPPVCEASVSAKAACQAKCSGSATCDVKANPPTCTGGTLTISCAGNCTAQAGASLSCTGSCTGSCQGTCTAKGGVAVDCDGKCEGICSAGGSAGGTGIQADGTCKGTCSSKCTASATAPAITCSGTCDGKCDATCQGSATASVKCDGKCDADYQPLSCSGGKLEGGCQADAKCDANCDASVQAKAECTPPTVVVTINGGANAAIAGKLQSTLEAHLPIILLMKARLEGVVAATATFAGDVSAVTDIKPACIPVVVSATATAVNQITISVTASADLVQAVQ
jgi:hypothetical protein